MYDAIADALRRGAHAEALAGAQALAEQLPHDVMAQRLLAQSQRLTGDRAAAQATIERAIQRHPEEAALHLDRAGLLLEERQVDEAKAALARSIGLDPNQFPAYIMQGQLALGRGDVAEAERLWKSAQRIAADHPHVTALEGAIALRRNDADRALALLSQAAQQAPGDSLVRHNLGFAYLAKGHLAFAEQAFRSLAERSPESLALQLLVVDLVRRQQRYAEAADMLAPLTERADASAGMRRYLGELELAAGRNERAAAPLRAAFAEMPGDRATVSALVEAWTRTGAVDEARETLEQALTAHSDQAVLWQARLAFEPFASDEAHRVIARWQVAMPRHIPALEAQVIVHEQAGDAEKAESVVRRIVELEPGYTPGELRLIELIARRDPAEAVARVEQLLAQAPDPNVKRSLRQLRGHLLAQAGRADDAVAEWVALQAEVADQRLPLPPHSTPRSEWPEPGPMPDNPPALMLLWGPPGSMVERLAQTYQLARCPLFGDRYGATPPNDFLQRYTTVPTLDDGSADPAALVDEWRATLVQRGARDGHAFDWLLWWDNALLRALRPHVPEALLVIAMRDPRDMLLDWIAYGAPMPLRVESPEAAARWLAQLLGQVAALHEQDWYPHRLVRLDAVSEDPAGIAQAAGDALGITLSPPPPGSFGPRRYGPGEWRRFAGGLGAAFALLAPVAKRLGYAEG
ncbi:tetratricopeptide repeat protein [Tolypothrix campylonemoides VB511288]|nr:tetratricopeptide repeat protein [Tolypothrix campylonemoides VB511288]